MCDRATASPDVSSCRFPMGDMDKIFHSTTDTVFSRLNPAKHLAPLSIYSRMISCEEKASLHHQGRLSNPFINFKIEIVNNCAIKRKRAEYNPDDYETPAKKARSPKNLSPDLGCLDYSSPPARQDSVSSFMISMPELLEKESVSSPLLPQHVESKSSAEAGVDEGTVLHCSASEEDLLNVPPVFDCDVDDILCLNPLGQKNTTLGFSANVGICKSPSGNTFQNNPVATPTVAHGEKLERGDGQVEEGREELEKEMHLNVNGKDDDKGYFSMSYTKECKIDSLEGEVEEGWTVGPPMLQSSVCHGTPAEEETTLDTSFEKTLPLRVKVKSVVVAMNQHPWSSKAPAPPVSAQTAKPPKLSTDSRGRPVVFDSDLDWEREKRLYVHSVMRHMREQPCADEDVTSELQNLMTHVADQTPGTGRQWQHPSDITRRNYTRRFGNKHPKMTLHEWKAKNDTHRRFSNVPKIFVRSHVC